MTGYTCEICGKQFAAKGDEEASFLDNGAPHICHECFKIEVEKLCERSTVKLKEMRNSTCLVSERPTNGEIKIVEDYKRINGWLNVRSNPKGNQSLYDFSEYVDGIYHTLTEAHELYDKYMNNQPERGKGEKPEMECSNPL